MASEFLIGELSKRTGVKVPTIRYYEDIGLLPAPQRTESGQRRYDSKARDHLGFIAHAREMGFSIDAIRSLIELSDHPDRPCHDADRIAADRLAEVKTRIARLKRLESELERMVDGHCGGSAADCRIIEVLSDHSHCQADH